MLSPEVLAPHPSAVPSPGGPPKSLTGWSPPLAQSNPPLLGQKSEVNPDSVWETCCTVCREEGVQAAPFPPRTPLQLVNGAPEVSGTERRRRGAGVGYSFDLLDQFLLQT